MVREKIDRFENLIVWQKDPVKSSGVNYIWQKMWAISVRSRLAQSITKSYLYSVLSTKSLVLLPKSGRENQKEPRTEKIVPRDQLPSQFSTFNPWILLKCRMFPVTTTRRLANAVAPIKISSSPMSWPFFFSPERISPAMSASL